MDLTQQTTARELLGQTVINSTEKSPVGISTPFQIRQNPFFCRHCKQIGPTPPAIQHLPTCLITRIQSFLKEL